jgi:hypothetical protein
MSMIALKQARSYFSRSAAKEFKYLCETHKVKAQKKFGKWYVDVKSIIEYRNGKTQTPA